MGFLRVESALKAKLAGPPPVFPGNLAGTVLWVAADGTKTLVNDGTSDRLSQWNNGSGSSDHLTQATVAQRPYWVTNQLNAFPVADFRLAQWIAGSTASGTYWTPSVAENAEIWVVFRPETLQAGSHLVNINQGTTTNALQIRWNATNLEFAYRTASGLSAIGSAITVNTWYIARLRKAGTTVTGYINGLQVAQATDARAAVVTSSGSPIVLGGREDNTNCIDGKILECWIGNQLLSTADAAALEAYLHDRYGLLLPRVAASAKNAANANTETTGVSVTHGFSLRNNDVLYAFLAQGDDPGTGWASTSGGTWTQIANQATTTGDDRASGVLRRVITNAAGEPSSYTFTRPGNAATDHIAAIVVQVRSADTTTPEDATPTVAQGSNDFTPPGANITTVNANSLILAYHLGVIGTGKTAGAPSGFTLVDSQQSNLVSFGLFQEVAQRHQATAGTVTVGDWTGTPDDATTEYDVITVAARQAPAVGAGIIGDLDLSHAINSGTIWAVSSHPSGSSLLGKELVTGTAFTLIGTAAFNGAHPDNASQLGLNCGVNEGATASSASIFADIAENVTMFMDLTIRSIDQWGNFFCLPYHSTGWTSPFGRLQLARNSSTASFQFSFDISSASNRTATSAADVSFAAGRHRFAVVKSGTTVTFYYDSLSSGTVTSTIAAGNLDTTGGDPTRQMHLFTRSNDSLDEWVDGICHRGQIWNRALTSTEIADLISNSRLGTYT